MIHQNIIVRTLLISFNLDSDRIIERSRNGCVVEMNLSYAAVYFYAANEVPEGGKGGVSGFSLL